MIRGRAFEQCPARALPPMEVHGPTTVNLITMPLKDPAIVREAELRRYLHRALVLLGDAELHVEERIQSLRRARHLTSAVFLGIEQILREEVRAAIPEPIEDPLTANVETATMRFER